MTPENKEPGSLCKYGYETKSCTSSPMDCQCVLDATFAMEPADHIGDANKMVLEPFGYFRATLDGWIDCAETDEGAKPLYEYAEIAKRDAEIERLKHQVQTAFVIVNRGVALMSHEQLGQWEGVGSFTHQATDDYYTDSELIATLRAQLAEAQAIVEAARNLVKVKGRYHTEQAFIKLTESLSKQP